MRFTRREALTGAMVLAATLGTKGLLRNGAKAQMSAISIPGARTDTSVTVSSYVPGYRKIDLVYSLEAEFDGTPIGGSVVSGATDGDRQVKHVVPVLASEATHYARLSSGRTWVGAPIRFKPNPHGTTPWTRKWVSTSCQVLPQSNPKFADTSLVQLGWSDLLTYAPDLGWFSGDYGYWSKSVTTDYLSHLNQYRKQTFAFPLMAQAMASWCWDQMSDDHEFGARNPDSFDNPIKAANIEAMARFFALHPLADLSVPKRALYGSYLLSPNVRVVMLDAESLDRTPAAAPDDSAKTFLGVAQDAWLRTLLLDRKPLNIIICGKSFLGESDTYNTSADKIWNYRTWRDEYAAFIRDNQINTVWVGGDRHFNGYCSAATNPYGTGPVWLASGISAGAHLLATGEGYDWTDGAESALHPTSVMGYVQGAVSDDLLGTITFSGQSRYVPDTSGDPSTWVMADGGSGLDVWTY